MMAVTEEHVAWAYRLLLDREAEQGVDLGERGRQAGSTRNLRKSFLLSQEFSDRNRFYLPSIRGDEPAMDVQSTCAPADMRSLIDHMESVWTRLGREEPHWSVLSSEQFRSANLQANLEAFEASGRKDMQRLIDAAARNGIELPPKLTCLELGCGLGRVTRFLGTRFERIHAYDISGEHLRYAREYLERKGVGNVELRRISSFEDVRRLPPVDVCYSIIVLQHNPPPLIRATIDAMLAALRPGGVAYFQVPTYRLGYSFEVQSYLRELPRKGEIEMHVLPQRDVFETAFANGCCPIEVVEDGYTGNQDLSSTTFFLRKAAAPART